MPDEKILIEKTKAGDMDAFDALFHMYSQKLYSFAYGLLKDHEQTEDLVQDVFIVVWEKRSQINADYNFSNYLYTIGYHAILKYFRRKKIERQVLKDLTGSSQLSYSDAHTVLIYNEMAEIISMVIDAMPHKQRMVFQMSRVDGKSIAEIAAELHISSRTVETHITRALKQIRTKLKNIYPEVRVKSSRRI